MAIDTLAGYLPTYTLPLYVKITYPHQNHYDVGKEYEMRIEDQEREKDEKDHGPFNYAHEAVLVSKEKKPYSEINPYVLALAGYSKSKSEAEDNVIPLGDPDPDEEVAVLVFLRIDATEKFVDEELWLNDSSMEKVNYEI